MIDRDDSGTITKQEFFDAYAAKTNGQEMPDGAKAKINEMFAEAEADGEDGLTKEEVMDWMAGDA